VTITLYYRADGVAEKWIEEFEALYPHINVEFQARPGSGWEDQLLAQMISGTAPDVFEFWGAFGRQLEQRGLLLNLTPYVERDFTQEEIADFYPAVWESSFTRFGPRAGSQYRMPRYINVMVMYYNIDDFQEAGLMDPAQLDQLGEWTWEMFRQSARKLTVRDAAGEITRYGVSLGISSVPRMLNWIWGAGGDLLDPNDPTRFIGHQDEAKLGARFLQEMIWEEEIAAPVHSATYFLQGRVSMLDDGMSEAFRLYNNSTGLFDMDVIRRPAGPAGRWSYLVDDSFGIWSGTPHPEEAWLLVRFLVSRKGQEILIANSGLPPVRRSASQAYFDLVPGYNLRAFADAVVESRPTIYSRMTGDIAQIDSAFWELFNLSIRSNQYAYDVAVDMIRPRIEALLGRPAE